MNHEKKKKSNKDTNADLALMIQGSRRDKSAHLPFAL